MISLLNEALIAVCGEFEKRCRGMETLGCLEPI